MECIRDASDMRISVSEYATAPIRVLEPRTDDMRAMVDRIGTNPCRVPGAYRMGGVLIVHPEIQDRLVRGSLLERDVVGYMGGRKFQI